jgi:hypothetical protein
MADHVRLLGKVITYVQDVELMFQNEKKDYYINVSSYFIVDSI